jgi:hypothetical protein
MTNHPRLTSALALALIVAAGSSTGTAAVAEQASNPCALLKTDEIQPVAVNASIADGVQASLPSIGMVSCRYTWGEGTGKYKLDVIVNDAAKMFPGLGPDQIKKALAESVKPGTADTAISDVGEAAIFKADSYVYTRTTAYLKGQVLQIHLDGIDAQEKKGQLIGLLKSAASRL